MPKQSTPTPAVKIHPMIDCTVHTKQRPTAKSMMIYTNYNTWVGEYELLATQ